MKQNYFRSLLCTLLLIMGISAWATVDDVLNLSFVGVSGSSYTDFSKKTGASGAIYAGQCAGGNSSIQLRSKNSDSGVVTTTSGGTVKKIAVEWNSNTMDGRTLNVYGRNAAYSSAKDLYTNSQGTLIGTIVKGTSTELEISDNYTFIGVCSAKDAMYLSSITITWESDGSATTKTATTTTFDGESSYTITEGDEFVAPTATVTGGENLAPAYTSSNEAVATVNATTGAVEIKGVGTTTITATFAGNEDYKSSSASYTLTVKAVAKVYTLEELVAADITAGTEVTVAFSNVVIKDIFTTSSGYRNGVYFDIQKDGKDIEIYYKDVPAEWVKGGTLSGTMTCPWTSYNGTWELAPKSGSWAWSNLTYEAPADAKSTAQITLDTYKNSLVVEATDTYAVSYNGDAELVVTSSDPEIASVSLAEGNIIVTALAAGKTIITVSAEETDKYYAAIKSYTLTVTEPAAPAKPAALPFAFDGGKADIANTQGMTQEGLGTDYKSSPYLKFDSDGDYVVINFAEAARKLSYTIKGNSMSGTYEYDVQESADGIEYTTLKAYTYIGDAVNESFNLQSDTRFVKFVYVTKDGGNVALGNISITASSTMEDPSLAFGKDTYIFYLDGSDMQVIATSAAGSKGAVTYSCDDEDIVIDENTGEFLCETPGTYTITANIAASDYYSAGSTTCTVVVKETLAANSIIVSKTSEKSIAMTTESKGTYMAATQVYEVGETGFYVAPVQENIFWTTEVADGKATIQNPTTSQYLQTTALKNVSYTDKAYEWTVSEDGALSAGSNGYLLYNSSSPRFTTYASPTTSMTTSTILDKNVLVDGYARNVEKGAYGTICLPYAVAEGDYSGATFYSISSIEGNLLVLTPQTSLEAGKPYIFKANASAVVCAYSGAVVSAPVADDYLIGTFEDTETIEGSYVLQVQNDVAGFYLVAETKPTLTANHACLVVNEYDAEIKAYTFVENTTAISNVEIIDNSKTKIYDLSGRRVNNAQKGIYIMGGKKVVK